MKKYKYFELDEFLKSSEAKKRGIDNTPTFEVVEHLGELVERILDPLREDWGSSIKISSGYRCPKLNSAVKGAATSVHMLGYAADLQVSTSFTKFRDFVVNWVARTGVKFDQLLLESNKAKGTKWIHIGLYSNSGEQRQQVKTVVQ